MKVDIGDVGEDFFSTLCSQAGLIRNVSQRDKTGWDHLVEFPLEVVASLASAHVAPKSCYVQVKTSRKHPNAQIKGTNLVRMATSPSPCFIVFIVLNDLYQPTELYVKHFGQKLIEDALKLRYEVDSGKIKRKLNQVRRTIKGLPDERIDPLTPETMREALGRHIAPNMNEYSSWKSKLIQSVGFDKGHHLMTLSSKRADMPEKLMRMSLGYEESLEDFEMKHFIERFGYREETLTSLNNIQNAKLTMPDIQPTAQGTVTFREKPFGARITFDADLYMPVGLGMVPKEYMELRINLGLVDLHFQMGSGKSSVRAEIVGEERYKFDLLHRSLKLLSLLSKPKNIIKFTLDFPNTPLASGTLSDAAISFSQEDILKGLDAITSILGVVGESGEIMISCDDVVKNAPSIHHALPIYIGQPHKMRAEFNVDEPLNEGQEATCITLHLLKFGSIRLVGVLVLTGEISLLSDGRYRVETERCKVHSTAFLQPEDSLNDEQQASMLEEAEAAYCDQQVVILKD